MRAMIGMLFLVPLSASAEKFCLLLAENYYEQLYCEVKAMGHGDRLPSLADFRRNNEITQAFLLKRPAAKLGIQLAKPKKAQPVVVPVRMARPSLPSNTPLVPVESGEKRLDKQDQNIKGGSSFQHCSLHKEQIRCRDNRYRLMGNLSNKKLMPGVLGASNKMSIPVYRGSVRDGDALGHYLSGAYQQYLKKMLEIGLGGSTLSFSKFVYFYHDVSSKGIDFSQRFETMFDYLKKDKQRMAVSERLPAATHLVLSQCDHLAGQLIVCQAGQKNYLYQRQ